MRSRSRSPDSSPVFDAQALSKRVWCVVEHDRFGEQPHIYVVTGSDKAVVIDTGCDTADLHVFLRSLPGLSSIDFFVVNTHVHYDHIMGNHCFCQSGGKALRTDCVAICQGSRDRKFSEDWDRTSLRDSVDAEICPFCVTRWLDEGSRIYLNDKAPCKEDSLEILFTPGHTPDSISLYFEAEDRLFTGDLIYPGSLCLFLIGSSLEEFRQSVDKLRVFIAEHGGCTTLSCGHVTPKLPCSALQELHALLPKIRSRSAKGTVSRHPWCTDLCAFFHTDTFTLICRAADVS